MSQLNGYVRKKKKKRVYFGRKEKFIRYRETDIYLRITAKQRPQQNQLPKGVRKLRGQKGEMDKDV